MDNSGINYTDATRSGKRQFVLDETPTLRDQFAMAALTGLIVRSAEPNDGYERLVAKVSYIIADSMMEARK